MPSRVNLVHGLAGHPDLDVRLALPTNPLIQHYAGTIRHLVTLPRNANLPVPNLYHQTSRPAVNNGDRRRWPNSLSPIARNRPHKQTLLVDTGAEVSVVPASRADRKRQQDFSLSAVNNTSITTFGKRSLSLNLGLWRTFRWIFVVADVQKPIIGADFLHHFGLLVDLT